MGAPMCKQTAAPLACLRQSYLRGGCLSSSLAYQPLPLGSLKGRRGAHILLYRWGHRAVHG